MFEPLEHTSWHFASQLCGRTDTLVTRWQPCYSKKKV